MSERDALMGALDELLALIEPKRKKLRGLLGIPGGTTVTVPGRDYYVYYREKGDDARFSIAFCNKAPHLYDLPVIIGFDTINPNTIQVLDIDMEALADWEKFAAIGAHHWTHEYGTTDDRGVRVDNDVVYVQKAQIVPLMLNITGADMYGHVQPDWYSYGDWTRRFPGAHTQTFTPPADADRARLDLVYVDVGQNSLNYTEGDLFTPTTLGTPEFPENFIPDSPTGAYEIALVHLYTGQTALTNEFVYHMRPYAYKHGPLFTGLAVTGDVEFFNNSHQPRFTFDADNDEFDLVGGIDITGNINITGNVTIQPDNELVLHRTTPINSDVQLGRDDDTSDISGYGKKLYFSGAPGGVQTDFLWVSRYNVQSDYTELRVRVSDNQDDNDWFSVGSESGSTWMPAMEIPTAGGFVLDERSDPSAPSSNRAHIYVRDNGAGKTQLVVRFPTGVVQVIATEP